MVHVHTAMSGVRNSKKFITCKIFITCSISRVVMQEEIIPLVGPYKRWVSIAQVTVHFFMNFIHEPH